MRRLGASGLPMFTTDMRVPNATTLLNGLFPSTSTTRPYDNYVGDMVHRLFHMWQQSDCSVSNATPDNPSGCLNDLYPFVGIARNDNSGSNVMGWTAANHILLGSGDAIFWTPFQGVNQPPANVVANPNPVSPTSDRYKAD